MTARDMKALAYEVAESATALTNYINAVKHLHSTGGRHEAVQIDLILAKAEEQLQRLRSAVHDLHQLADVQAGKSAST